MNLSDDLHQAATRAMDDAATAAAALAPACDALQAAVDRVALAWVGGRAPHVGNLYQRQLQPLVAWAAAAVPAVAAGDAPPATGPTRVPAALMESCRVFTPLEIADAVWQAAGKPDMAALRQASAIAAGQFVQAMCSLHLLLEDAVALHGDNGELASLLVAASQLQLHDKAAIGEAWRRRQRGAARQGPFETLPAHIAEQAAVQALRSPLDGLLQVVLLLRQAAEHLDAMPTRHLSAGPYTSKSASGSARAAVHVR